MSQVLEGLINGVLIAFRGPQGKLWQVRLIIFFLFLSACTGLFYLPDRYLHAHPKHFKIAFEELWFKSENGIELNAWYLKNSVQVVSPRGIIVFFHGNAQNLSAHFVALAWLTQHGYDVFVPDYRGYGQSDGNASPEGVYTDSLAILNKGWELFQRDKHQKFIIYGQSLGGAIAMRAHQEFIHKDKVDLLVLDSTFMSYKRVAWSVATGRWFTIPFAPIAWLLISDKYGVSDYVAQITTPTLVIHSRADRVVAFKHGEAIFQQLTCQKKWFWNLENLGHIQSMSPKEGNLRQRFIEFLNKL